MFGTEKLLGRWLARSHRGRAVVDHVRAHPFIYDNLKTLAEVIVLFLVLRATVVESFRIPSASMRATLMEGDRIIVQKVTRYWSLPDRGDIVVFHVPETIPGYDPDRRTWIKRVVGLPGDRVRVADGQLFINGQHLVDPPIFRENQYTNYCSGRHFDETIVPPDQLFLMGDNSANSTDSRVLGTIPVDNIVGIPMFRFWPPSRIGIIDGVPPAHVRQAAQF